MALTRNRSYVQINKIKFKYDVCLKKFMFSNHHQKKKLNLVKISIKTVR